MSDPIEAVVVNSLAHQVTFGGTCLDCGRDAREPTCCAETFDLGAPPVTLSGEIVGQPEPRP